MIGEKSPLPMHLGTAAAMVVLAWTLSIDAGHAQNPAGLPRPPTWGTYVDTKAWPWTAIGRVNPGIPTQLRGGYDAPAMFCTGVLVAPRIVLTAAHCVLVGYAGSAASITYRRLDPERILFRSGQNQNRDFGYRDARFWINFFRQVNI